MNMRKMSARQRCFSFFTFFLVLFAGIGFLRMPKHRINAKSYELIKEGMTLPEVESIIGVPAGHYERDEVDGRDISRQDEYQEVGPYSICKRWSSDAFEITVALDGENRVALKSLLPVSFVDNSFIAKIKRWFGICGF